MRPLASKEAWDKKFPSKAEALRKALSDDAWHGQPELSRVAGHRFGAVLWRAHRAQEPIHYERLQDEKDASIIFYRRVHDTAKCAACTQQPLGSGLVIKRQAERIVELEKENAALRARFAAGWGA